MYCAGSFVVEDPLLQPFLGKREGELESVQGMPIALTNKLLEEARLARLRRSC
jgi:septum formation protein